MLENQSYKSEEETTQRQERDLSDLQKRGGNMHRQERDLSSGRIFQCVSGLAYHGSGAIESLALQ
jgi:hypothetical protein